MGERVRDRVERVPVGGAVVGDDVWQPPRPGAALSGERRAVELEEAAVDAAAAFRHGPVREPLIEVAGEESNQRRMHPGVRIEVVHFQEPVAMTDRDRPVALRRRSGLSDGPETRVPQPAHRPRLVADALVELAKSRQGGPGVRRHVAPESREGVRFLENPAQFAAVCGGNAVQHDSPPEIEPGSDARDVGGRTGIQVFGEQRLHVPGENPARRQLLPVAGLREVRLAAEPAGGAFDGLLERQVLEGVQRVVVDEDADRPLRRQQMGQPVDHAAKRMVGIDSNIII